MNKTQKKGKNVKNTKTTTKKQGQHVSVQVPNLSDKQKEIICKKANITF